MFHYAFIGLTLQTAGGIMVAYMALTVHFRFWKEHQVDDKVFAWMRREQKIGVIGIMLIISGYVLQVLALM